MTMITPSYLGETIEYSSLHACRSTLEDPTCSDFSSASKGAFELKLTITMELELLDKRKSLFFLAKLR